MSDRHEAFERRLAEWGGRPASTPAAIAGHRGMRSALARPPSTLPWRFAAAALVVLAAALVVWRAAPPGSPLDAGHPFPSALDGNVVVWIIDPETTALHVLEPSGSGKDGTPRPLELLQSLLCYHAHALPAGHCCRPGIRREDLHNAAGWFSFGS